MAAPARKQRRNHSGTGYDRMPQLPKFDPKNHDLEKVKETAGQLFLRKEWDDASKSYSRVLEILTKKHGTDVHDELGEFYYKYGFSLLELYRKESGPLGDAVPREVATGTPEPPDSSDEEDLEEEEEEEEEEAEDEENDNEENEGKDENAEKKEKTEEKAAGEKVKTDEKSEKEVEVKDGKKAESETEKGDKKEESAEKTESSTTKDGNSKDKASGDPVESLPGCSSGAKQADTSQTAAPQEEEEPTDLQLAWEALEVARKIFMARGDPGRDMLAETLLLLADVALESSNFQSAVEDCNECYNIYKVIGAGEHRTLAEITYKLGISYAGNAQYDEAVTNYETCIDYLKKRREELVTDDDKDCPRTEEIEDLDKLIAEVEERLADISSVKSEMESKKNSNGIDHASTTKAEKLASPSEFASASSSSSSSKPANDISHLVKRKRKSDEDGAGSASSSGNPAKKPAL